MRGHDAGERDAGAAARSFLMLQGPLSPLYARLADRLEQVGHEVCRVNLCFGDRMHWSRPGAVDFRGRPAAFGAFVAALIARRAVSDVVLHGECRLYHRIAADEARRQGARVHVTELGYLRPDWMTVDRDGTAAASAFPRDPGSIARIAAACDPVDLTPRYPAHFSWVAAPDVAYNLSSSLLWFLYPHYRRHTIDWPPLEYAAWVWRLSTARRRGRAAEARIARIVAEGRPLFLFALQLEGDFQVRARSPFQCQTDALEMTAASFAAHAPARATLAIKTHPLDNGLRPWRPVVRAIAGRHRLEDRIVLLDGGNLAPMIERAQGVVTINSSAGLEAILAGVPVKALAPALYDVPGLTHAGPIDAFWTSPQNPDGALARTLVRALAGSVQVRGTIYSREGLAAAVDGIADAILTDRARRMTSL